MRMVHFQSLGAFLVLSIRVSTVDTQRTHHSSTIRIVCVATILNILTQVCIVCILHSPCIYLRICVSVYIYYVYIYIYVYIYVYVYTYMYMYIYVTQTETLEKPLALQPFGAPRWCTSFCRCGSLAKFWTPSSLGRDFFFAFIHIYIYICIYIYVYIYIYIYIYMYIYIYIHIYIYKISDSFPLL